MNISTYVVLPPPFYSLVEEMNSGQQKGLNSAIQNVLKHMVSRLFQRLKFYVFFKKHIIPYSRKKYKNIDSVLSVKHCNNIPYLDDEKKGLVILLIRRSYL